MPDSPSPVDLDLRLVRYFAVVADHRPGEVFLPRAKALLRSAAQAAVQAGRAANPHLDLRPDLTTVPLHGVEPSHVVLATRAGDHSLLVVAFRKSAQPTSPLPALPRQRAPRHHELGNDGHAPRPTAPSTEHRS